MNAFEELLEGNEKKKTKGVTVGKVLAARLHTNSQVARETPALFEAGECFSRAWETLGIVNVLKDHGLLSRADTAQLDREARLFSEAIEDCGRGAGILKVTCG